MCNHTGFKKNRGEIIKSQGSYGYLLPIELGVEIGSNNEEYFIVGEDLEVGDYSSECFSTLKEAEEAFERRLQERRS